MTEKRVLKAEPISCDFDYKSLNDNLYDVFIEKMNEAIINAEYKIVKAFADELGVSEKCARFFMEEHFNLRIKIEYSNDGTPIVSLVAEPKSVEEILSTDFKENLECEKQLIKN